MIRGFIWLIKAVLIVAVIIFLLSPITGHNLFFEMLHHLEIGFTGHTGINGPNVHVGK
jgi:hypothetical protein